MALPAWLARFNRRVTNPILGRLTGRVGPFAIVVHRGRTSGRVYRTPVLVFRAEESVVIALTYGAGADWVRNVLASGGATIVVSGQELALDRPKVIPLAAATEAVPAPVRWILRIIRATDCLRLYRT